MFRTKLLIFAGASITFILFQNFDSITKAEQSYHGGSRSDLVNSFESHSSMDRWILWNNCSDGSTAQVQHFNNDNFEGKGVLRLQTKSFRSNCLNPGMFALSQNIPTLSGRRIKVGAYIRNGLKIRGATRIIFYDKTGKSVSPQDSKVSFLDWTTSGPWNWPKWNRPGIISVMVPSGATSFRVRFDLTQENSTVDIDSLEIAGNKLKGFNFNPVVINGAGIDIGLAWQLWLARDKHVRKSVEKELEDLIDKVQPTYIHILTNSKLTGYPAKRVDPYYIESMSQFINFAFKKGVQVAIHLGNHCVIAPGHAEATGDEKDHLANRGFPPCADDNITESKNWHKAIIQGIETKIEDTRSIAYWEFGGNPVYGGAEMPAWSASNALDDVYNSVKNRHYPGLRAFISSAFPHFKSLTKRPTAISLLHVYTGTDPQSWDLSAYSNTRDALSKKDQPDYYLVFASGGTPIERVFNEIPSEKVVLSDFGWTQGKISDFNPKRLTAVEILNRNLGLVRKYDLPGYWIWAYRDHENDPEADWGVRKYNNSWKEERIQKLVRDISGKNNIYLEARVFNLAFYRALNKGLSHLNNQELTSHWLSHGIKEGRQASLGFKAADYLALNPDLAKELDGSLKAAIEHYITIGIKEKRQTVIYTSPMIFNAGQYKAIYPQLKNTRTVDLVAHWLNFGIKNGDQAHRFFKASDYLALNPDLSKAFGGNLKLAIHHYVTKGIKEKRQAVIYTNPRVLNIGQYKAIYPQLKNFRTVDLVAYWLNFGIKNGDQAHRFFKASDYLALNPDLAKAFDGNLKLAINHYVNFGHKEQRKAVFPKINRSLADE